VLEVYHTDSVQPREFEAVLSDVPPTDVTYREAAGYSVPALYAPSPEDTVMATPGWLNYEESYDVSDDDSEPP
jgi:hypothetical protein